MPQTGTPDTVAYLVLGLSAVAVIMGAFLVSLAVRYRNLRKDADLIEQLERDEQ
jgi:hypothetical protein